jgi:hypothetical protein
MTMAALQRQILQVRVMDPGMREILCVTVGGHEAYLKSLEDELEGIRAKRREQKPLAQQKASAEAHLKRTQKAREEAATKLEELQAEQALLAARVADQQSVLAEAESKLQKARLEMVTVAEKATAEIRGTSLGGSAVTAMAVTSFFAQLPAEVAEHPEGKQAVQMVMPLMQKLDEAKKAVEASTTRALDGTGNDEQVLVVENPADPEFEAFEEVDMDDDLVAVVARRMLRREVTMRGRSSSRTGSRGFVVKKTSKQK